MEQSVSTPKLILGSIAWISFIGIASLLLIWMGHNENSPVITAFGIVTFLAGVGLLFFGYVSAKGELKKSIEKEEKLKNQAPELYLECENIFKTYSGSSDEHYVIFLGAIKNFLTDIVKALEKGEFEESSEKLKSTYNLVDNFERLILEIRRTPSEELYVTWVNHVDISQVDPIKKVLDFAARACDALYLGDVEKMRELLNEAREMLDERDKFVIGDVKFFKYLFEFHYFLLKTVVEAYEAEVGAVAKATQEQAERFAKAKPVEVPQTVEKVAVPAEEPEKELYRGEVRFKMGAMSQERVGTLVITNKRLKLTGKYRLRGMVATVAVKAALRAAGVGEVYEDIALKGISFLELKKALLGGYYLEFKAKGKKYTIYTDAAQHIYNILKQYQ